MRLIAVEVPEDHTVVLGGDWHVGNRACSHDAIKAQIARVNKGKNTFFAHMGDVAEMTPIDHKNFSVDQLTPPPGWDEPLVTALDQYDYFEEIFTPISDKTIAVVQGNHDMRMNNSAGNLLQSSCRRMDVTYGTYMCKVAVYIGDEFHVYGPDEKQPRDLPDYKMLLWHGWGSSNPRAGSTMRRQTNLREAIRRKLEPLAADCDVMAMGHIHRLEAFTYPNETMLVSDNHEIQATWAQVPPTVIDIEGKKHRLVHPDSRWYCVTGTTLKGYDLDHKNPYTTYSEKSGYTPADIGWVEIHHKDGKLTAEPVLRERS